jgi:hypothetical protein
MNADKDISEQSDISVEKLKDIDELDTMIERRK